jgi:hypothetical protein
MLPTFCLPEEFIIPKWADRRTFTRPPTALMIDVFLTVEMLKTLPSFSILSAERQVKIKYKLLN